MKKISILFLLLTTTFNYSIAAPANITEFAQTLKVQQKSIAANCESDITKSNQKLDNATKKKVKSYCSCVATNTANNQTYVNKMYKVVKTAKSEQEYVQRMETIGAEIGNFCQQKVSTK